jgi:glycerol-3-phosphate acyltransferase PlsY
MVAMLLLVPGLALSGRDTVELLWASAIAVFVIARHAGNIVRVATRSERTIG